MIKKSVLKNRREQVRKAGSTVFIAVAIAAVIVMVSVICIRFLWTKKSYNDRVVTAKTKARDDIRSNVNNLDKLAEQYPQLDTSPTTNATTLLHALPPVYDYASLTTSLNALAVTSGVKFNGSSGSDASADSVLSAPVSQPIEIPITIQVSGDYNAIRKFVTNIEKSIRPIKVGAIGFSGSNEKLDAQIQAVTYYQPPRSLDVTKKEVR